MAEITAKLVNELRSKTGQPMMDCKKMLEKTGGDLNAAIDEFRKKGVKSSLAERSASEGRVIGVAAQDGKAAALVEINCNTDFTAKSEPFLKLVRRPHSASAQSNQRCRPGGGSKRQRNGSFTTDR